MYQPCVSPNWDTALAAKALLDAGMDPAHPALGRAADWLIENQIFRPGDWSVHRPGLEPGGWAFEFANDWYPDVDDSAVILMVLQRLPMAPTPAGRRADRLRPQLDARHAEPRRRLRRLRHRQHGRLPEPHPVRRHGGDDRPADRGPDRSAPRAAWASIGYGADFGRARRAIEFLRQTQRADGSWWGRWGVNFIYGTWSRARRPRGDRRGHARAVRPPRRRLAHGAAERRRRLGRDDRVVRRRALAGQGESTPSQTAWALLGLLAADGPRSAAVERGVDYLLRTPATRRHLERSGSSPGTGFPRHFYLRYHLYRHYFPLMALGAVPAAAARRRRRWTMSVGIDRLAVYVPAYALPLPELARGARRAAGEADGGARRARDGDRAAVRGRRSRSPRRAGARCLRARRTSIPARSACSSSRPRRAVDHAKPVGIFVHELLGIGRHCRVVRAEARLLRAAPRRS